MLLAWVVSVANSPISPKWPGWPQDWERSLFLMRKLRYWRLAGISAALLMGVAANSAAAHHSNVQLEQLVAEQAGAFARYECSLRTVASQNRSHGSIPYTNLFTTSPRGWLDKHRQHDRRGGCDRERDAAGRNPKQAQSLDSWPHVFRSCHVRWHSGIRPRSLERGQASTADASASMATFSRMFSTRSK